MRLNFTRAFQCFGIPRSELQTHQGAHGKRSENLKIPILGKGMKKVTVKAMIKHITETMRKQYSKND
eukprot:13322851-Ditylum_brightwellii.AAC.1